MLLSLLTLAAMMLFGSWIFGNIIPSARKTRSSHPSTLTNQKISLWSLLWLLFFPSFQQLSSPVPPQELN